MAIKLNVPFLEKDEAKSVGAFWVPDLKTWIIPDHVKSINEFKPWLPQGGGTIIKSPYLIARSTRMCWRCRKETPLIALAAERYFTTEFSPRIESEWIYYEHPAFFVYVKHIDSELVNILQDRFPFFRRKYVKKVATEVWVNTCVHCETIQGDDYNTAYPHSSFGGYQNEKKTLFRDKSLEHLKLRYDYYLDATIFEGYYYWDGFSEAE